MTNGNISQEHILQQLKSIIDPDLNQDIVSLGFIKNLLLDDGHIKFDIELTTPQCPIKDLFKKQAENLIKELPGVKTVTVNITSNKKNINSNTTKNLLSSVKNIIAIASGKGGVGKSTVAVNLALALKNTGAIVGLLDADIYGPSIPTMLGIQDSPQATPDKNVIPLQNFGISLMSIGFLSPLEKPVIWRGPMVHGIITQFLELTEWGYLDYLIIDLPPGTGDAQLSIAQNCNLSGAIIISTPQDISLIDAHKALTMFQEINVPILGLIENMSCFVCPHCQQESHIFKSGGVEKTSNNLSIPLLGKIPLDAEIVSCSDEGTPIVLQNSSAPSSIVFSNIAKSIIHQLKKPKNKPTVTTFE